MVTILILFCSDPNDHIIAILNVENGDPSKPGPSFLCLLWCGWNLQCNFWLGSFSPIWGKELGLVTCIYG